MPHFHYCGRYWRFGGDELSIPSLCSIGARLVWTAFIAIVLGVTASDLQQCSDGWVIELYLAVSLFLFCVAIVCDMFLMKISLMGTMTQSEPRKQLTHYLNLKFVLCALQSLCAIFGIISIAKDSDVPCENDFRDSKVTVILVLIVAILQFAEWFVYGCGLYCLQTAGRSDHDIGNDIGLDPNAPLHGTIGGSNAHPHRLTEEAIVTWENRCRSIVRIIRWLTCNLFGGNNVEEGFQQVARVLTTFFHHDGFLDVVASDIAAAIVLVRVEQRANRFKQAGIDGNNSGYIESDSSKGNTSGKGGMSGKSNLDDTIAIDLDDDVEANRATSRTVSEYYPVTAMSLSLSLSFSLSLSHLLVCVYKILQKSMSHY